MKPNVNQITRQLIDATKPNEINGVKTPIFLARAASAIRRPTNQPAQEKGQTRKRTKMRKGQRKWLEKKKQKISESNKHEPAPNHTIVIDTKKRTTCMFFMFRK